jgi:NDP-sugar pyrophosphorylase family protein
MEPRVFRLIPKNKLYGMDAVIKKAMNKKKLVSSFITKQRFTDIDNRESHKKAYQEHI